MPVAIDIETKDPLLKQFGPGTINKTGKLLCVGMYDPESGLNNCYRYPQEKDKIARVLESDVTKIFHNGVYDLDWLINGAGFTINGRCEDTMTRATLLDSYQTHYNLEACCERAGVTGKNKGDTIDKEWRGKGKAIEHLDEIPFNIVAKYCIQDCKATYDLYKAQEPYFTQGSDMWCANDVEVRLYPYLIQMRGNGFPFDMEGRCVLSQKLNTEYEASMQELRTKYGIPDLNLGRSAHLLKIWQQEGLPVEYTESGNPSFSKEKLDMIDHPITDTIMHVRGLDKLLGTFIDGGFVDNLVNGRLHSTFYPAKRDEGAGGTVTGRFSSRNINLQQVPAREDKHGKEVRSLFIPEPDCLLGAFDYKQIEYRLFIHFAIMLNAPGAAECQQRFLENPNTDYHQMTIDMMGWGDMGKDGRNLAKNFNFGSIYGLGWRSFAVKFRKSLLKAHPNWDPDNLGPLAKRLMDEYFEKVSFAKPTINAIQDTCIRRGYVKTLGGRHQRTPLDGCVFKIVNYLIQGSAADIVKKAIVVAGEEGIWNVLKLHAQVHDELVFSIPKNREGYEASIELKNIMSSVYKLAIPLGVDTEIGPDWGHCNETNWKEFASNFEEVAQ